MDAGPAYTAYGSNISISEQYARLCL